MEAVIGRDREPVGVVGLGVMGAAMAGRLKEVGVPLVVFDLDPSRGALVLDLPGAAARVAGDVKGVAEQCSTVILSLNSAAIVGSVAIGQGLLEAMPPGGLVVDMSSIDPASTRELAAAADGLGVGWVDAPLSGGAPKATSGELSLMIGGESGQVDEARQVLRHLASRMTHCGPSGAGQAVKLINQVLVGAAFASLIEASALVRANDLDAGLVLEALTGGRADSGVLQEFFLKFATADPAPWGRVSNMLKDLGTAVEFGHATRRPCPSPASSLSCTGGSWQKGSVTQTTEPSWRSTTRASTTAAGSARTRDKGNGHLRSGGPSPPRVDGDQFRVESDYVLSGKRWEAR